MVIGKRSCVQARRPDFSERRGERSLLVWGELAQWMVLDHEAATFIAALDGRTPWREVCRAHGQRWGKSVVQVDAEARALVSVLQARGLAGPAPLAPPEVTVSSAALANVTFNVTNRCNLRCPWCYNGSRGGEEVPIEVVLAALAAARPQMAPDASLIILGGEPFLAPERLLPLLRGAAPLFGQPLLVSTNGTIMSGEMIAALAGLPVEVQVSLDGATARQHDAARGSGVFARALATIRALVAAGVRTIVSMVYHRDNLQNFEPLLGLAESLGVAEVRFIPLRAIGGGRAHVAQLPNQMEAMQRLLAIVDAKPALSRLLARDYFSMGALVLQRAVRQRNCGIGRQVLFIDADGSLYPCPNHVAPALRLGHVSTHPLAALSTTSEVLAEVGTRYDLARYHRCKSCVFRHWCAGDCRGEVVAMGGDAGDPSPHCAELRAMFRELMWRLVDGELPWVASLASRAGGVGHA